MSENTNNNLIKWDLLKLKDCFARNKRTKRCSATKHNYCGQAIEETCPFYKPYEVALEELDKNEYVPEDDSKRIAYEIITNDIKDEMKRNQLGQNHPLLKNVGQYDL